MQVVLTSACLLGMRSSYKGKFSKCCIDDHWLSKKDICFVPFCPEQIIGFSTPRPPVEIKGGDGTDVLAHRAQVITETGTDVTDQFLNGCDDILKVVQWTRPSMIVTQDRSPSCSCAGIYDGTFTHTLIPGYGVMAAFLKKTGYRLMGIDDFNKKRACNHVTACPLNGLAERPGFEPGLTGPEPVVLPLDDPSFVNS